MIKDKEMQIAVYHNLRVLLEEQLLALALITSI